MRRSASRSGIIGGSNRAAVVLAPTAGTPSREPRADMLASLSSLHGSTLSIDEFFLNFRHDKFARERFFWGKQCGGDAELSKRERTDLAKRILAGIQ